MQHYSSDAVSCFLILIYLRLHFFFIAIVRSSLARKETCACHFREDFPKENNKDYNGVTIFNKDNEIIFKN
ncbi:hypothetical protein COU57_02575 [Candidatus Pacearchaeota archaeon CG10_big_fil_rev_8_21_14_0_10_32_14]|nr:MAG: hypothetical protein COU57_02575 [Candidatus Pacearchaeota archaeon CG10_big_fil_rev_8_21_14_0_10_32_14]